MPEKHIELSLRKAIEKRGGKCYKWVAPGNRGVPDRIVILPGGRVIFVELKYGKNGLSPAQRNCQKILRALGNEVWNICSEQNLKEFLVYIDE